MSMDVLFACLSVNHEPEYIHIYVYYVYKLKHKGILYNILYNVPSLIKYIQYFAVLTLFIKTFLNLKRNVLKSELSEIQYISAIALSRSHSPS